MTSRQAVDIVVRAARPAKAGHAGTLDPMASGVLVVCVGSATRLIPEIQQMRKVYRAEFLLGRRSNTDDTTGEVVETSNIVPIAREEIEQALPQFIGVIDQVPPQFSAVHVDGRRAYKLARRGEQVELRARPVEIDRIDILNYEFPRLEVEIECGSGTYVRSIGRDLGEWLGCGAVMSGLVRTRIGAFRLEDAIALEDVRPETLAEHLQSAAAAVPDLRRAYCVEGDIAAIRHGRPVPYRGTQDFESGEMLASGERRAWSGERRGGTQDLENGEMLALLDEDGHLACLAQFDASRGLLVPKQVFPG
jgi:tRNA pseudouridine55 synthase